MNILGCWRLRFFFSARWVENPDLSSPWFDFKYVVQVDFKYVDFKYVVQQSVFSRNSEKFWEILKNQCPSFSEFLGISNMFSNMWISNVWCSDRRWPEILNNQCRAFQNFWPVQICFQYCGFQIFVSARAFQNFGPFQICGAAKGVGKKFWEISAELFTISDILRYMVQRSALGDIEKLYPWQLVNYFPRTSELTVKSRLCMHLANLSISGNFETPVLSDTFYPMCFDVTRDAADLRFFSVFFVPMCFDVSR